MMNVKQAPWLAAGFLALILLSSAPVPARASSTPPVVEPSPSYVLLADQPWHKAAYSWFANWVSSRSTMIQFAVIGMIIALIIICRNRW